MSDESHVELVVLNIHSTSAKHLRDYVSHGAEVCAPDAQYGRALELFDNTRLGGSVIWINTEGVSSDELARLEKHWLPIAGKAILLMGASQTPIVNRSLQSLMSARRENPSFEAVVMTEPGTSADTTSRLMASQSVGWLMHQTKDMHDPHSSIIKVMDMLNLLVTQPAALAALLPLPPAPVPTPDPTPAPAPAPEVATSQAPPLAATQPLSTTPDQQGNPPMATLTDSMNACMQIDGAIAAALVDFGSGMALAKIGTGLNLDMAAAGNTEVLKAKMKTMAGLGLKDTIEDMLITLGTQYHLIRPIPHKQGLFLYIALEKTKGNLAMARFKLMEIEKNITV